MNVHARIEWNLTKVNIDQQSVLILTGVEANGVGTTIEIRLGQSAVNGGVLHVRVCQFIDFVARLEFVGPRVIEVIGGLRVTHSNNPTGRGRAGYGTVDCLYPPFKC